VIWRNALHINDARLQESTGLHAISSDDFSPAKPTTDGSYGN